MNLERSSIVLKNLYSAMLIQSDNTAACKLINTIGKDRLMNIISYIGLTSTIINKFPSGEKEEFDNENITTSYDLCKCLELLNQGKCT